MKSGGNPMSDKTMLYVPGKKLSVPKVAKRTSQVLASVLLSAAVAFIFVLGSSMLVSQGTLTKSWATWLNFVNRGDIQATAILSSLVTVLFVYWQRDKERGK
jgi:hypothetical protein